MACATPIVMNRCRLAVARLGEVFRLASLSVEEVPLPYGIHGSCRANGQIQIEELLDTRTKVLVLAHEVCHFAAHFGNEVPNDDCEFQAEATSAVIGAMFGIASPGASDYILLWRGNAEKLRGELQIIHTLVKKVMAFLKVEELLTETREAA